MDRRLNGRASLFRLGLLLLVLLAASCEQRNVTPQSPVPGAFAITGVTQQCDKDNQPIRVISWSPAEAAEHYRVLRGDVLLEELLADTTAYTDTAPAKPGQTLTYRVQAVNSAGETASAPVSITIDPDICSSPDAPGEPGDPNEPGDPDNPGEPGEPDDPENPEEPEDPQQPEEPAEPEEPLGPPGPFTQLEITLSCEPFGLVRANWEPVNGATGYVLRQGDTTLTDEPLPQGTSSVELDLSPGQPFEFIVSAINSAGQVDSPLTLPTLNECPGGYSQVAAGNNEVLMVSEGGDVWGWGLNSGYVLGMGTEDVPKPRLLPNGPQDVRKVLLSGYMGIALAWDGTVQTWGTNDDGMLGREGITVLEQPEPLPGLGGITDIAVGDRHVLAVDDTGQVWLWGTFLDELIPVPEPVLPAEGIVAVAAGEGTAFGLRTDGSVIGWGRNPTEDVLGLGRAGDLPDPSVIQELAGVVTVHAAGRSLFVRRADGTVAALGDTHGLGSSQGYSDLPELRGVQSISLGWNHGLAVTQDGTVLSWGKNDGSQLGRPFEYPHTHEPLQPVNGLPPVASVFAGFRFSVAVDRTGKLYTWGSNIYHALGLNGIRNLQSFTDVDLPGLFIQVELGQDFAVALTASGQVYSWGNNRYGQLGRTTDTWIDWNPAPIQGLSNVIELAVGADFALALDRSKRVYAWGFATHGALGDGSSHLEYRTTPGQIASLSDITRIAAGTAHALAADSTGRLWAWGRGANGALGLADTADRDTPEQVDLDGARVQDIAAGLDYSLYLADENMLGGFGLNTSGQLGSWSVSDDQELPGLKHVFAGVNTSFAVNSLGDLWAWGGNSGRIKGCCVDGLASPEIVQVPTASAIGHVSAAQGTAIFLDRVQGKAYGIGFNQNGQLGIDQSNALAGPVEIPLTGTVIHASTSGHTSALVMDGKVYVSGSSANGLLTRTPLHNLASPRTPEAPRVASYPGH